MVQGPAVRNCALVPVTEHTLGVEDVKVTGKLEVAEATSVKEVSAVSVEGRTNAMVCDCCVPVPFSVIFCVAGLPLSALLVRVAELVSGPAAVGMKLRLKLQLAPGANDVVAVQSAGVPLPGACAKFAPTVKAVSVRTAFPIF
jgi:hypothetical protein